MRRSVVTAFLAAGFLGMAILPAAFRADLAAIEKPPVLTASVTDERIVLRWRFETASRQRDRALEIARDTGAGYYVLVTKSKPGKTGTYSDNQLPPAGTTVLYRARLLVLGQPGSWGPALPVVNPTASTTTTTRSTSTTRPPVAFTTTTTASTAGVTACPAAWDTQVRNAVNDARAAGDVAPLFADGAIGNAADARANKMATDRNMIHGNWVAEITVHYPYWGALAENIHAVVGPDRVVVDWMNSAGHRTNIMNDTYNDVGIGCFYATNGVPYWALVLGYDGTN